MRIPLALLFFLGFACSALGQSKIKGEIKDQASNEALEFASIALYTSQDSSLVEGAISDSKGEFRLSKLPEGQFYLVVSFLGYATLELESIVLTKGQSLDLGTLLLSADDLLLQGVEVQGQSIATEFSPERKSFSAASFEIAQGGTAIDVLKNLPSVSINGEGTLSIRGSTGFILMINGRPIQGDPMGTLAQLPANSIDKVEWLSTPSAQYDSEGKAGIINITTKKGATDGLYLQVNGRYGFPSIENYDNAESQKRFGGDFNLNYVKDQWDLSLGASYQRNDIAGRREGDVYTIDGDTSTFFPSDGERSIDEINYSARMTLGYKPNPENFFSVALYAGVRDKVRTADILYFDNHREISGQRTPPFQYFNTNIQSRRGDFALGSVDYSHTFGNSSSISTSFLYEYSMLGGPTINRNLGFPDQSIVYQDEFNTNDNPLNGYRYNLDYTFAPNELGSFQVGYQYRFLNHQGDFVYERKNNETGEFELVPEFSSKVDLMRTIHSTYLQWDKEINKWNFGAGIRLEAMNREFRLQDKAGTIDSLYLYDYIRPFLSGSISYSSSEDLQWSLSFTQRVERETTFKMNPFPEREHSETLEQGDPEVLPEFVNTLEAGMIKTWEANSFSASIYHTRIKNLVNRVNTVYNDTILNRIYSNVGIANSVGLELGTELFLSPSWKAYFGGNIYHYTIKGEFNDQPVNQAAWVYSFNITSSVDLSPTLSTQFTLNYLSQRITAQGEDSRFYQPSLSIKKTLLDGRLTANLIWQNIDMGLLKTNEQRITTYQPGEFFTSTNYIQEVDMLIFTLSYTLNRSKNRAKFAKSEFGEKEF